MHTSIGRLEKRDRSQQENTESSKEHTDFTDVAIQLLNDRDDNRWLRLLLELGKLRKVFEFEFVHFPLNARQERGYCSVSGHSETYYRGHLCGITMALARLSNEYTDKRNYSPRVYLSWRARPESGYTWLWSGRLV